MRPTLAAEELKTGTGSGKTKLPGLGSQLLRRE
jgi:hypothetical protein